MKLVMFFLILVLALSLHAETGFDSSFLLSVCTAYDAAQDSTTVSGCLNPSVSFSQSLYKDLKLQAEYSARGYVSSFWGDVHDVEMDLDHYRYWLLFGNPQSSIRLGLQRLSIGSAQMLRPLQWFDRVDPLDKTEQTQGVKAALIRQTWLNNSNLWLWGIWGEDSAKGNELIPSKDNSLEYGGRLQIPNWLGESAISYHQRKIIGGTEYRMGFDHRYDGPIGAWFEASGSSFEVQNPVVEFPRYQLSACLGLDYNIPIGKGLALTAENLIISSGNKTSIIHRDSMISALMANYPLGLLDSVTALAVYMHEAQTTNLILLWRRTYDYLSWDLSLSLDRGYSKSTSHSPTFYLKLNYNL